METKDYKDLLNSCSTSNSMSHTWLLLLLLLVINQPFGDFNVPPSEVFNTPMRKDTKNHKKKKRKSFCYVNKK